VDDTTFDRHRCRDPRCGRPFAVVCRRSLNDVPIPMAVACPRCTRWNVLMVPTGTVRDADGAYVLPLDWETARLAS
jgi:hypothetical protein